MSLRDDMDEALRAAPDHGGWRAGMDDDDYAAITDAALAVVDAWLGSDEARAHLQDVVSDGCGYCTKGDRCSMCREDVQRYLAALRALAGERT